jgi:chromosome segregation ATPase
LHAAALELELQELRQKAAEDLSLVLEQSDALESKAQAAEALADALQQQLRQTALELDAARNELAAASAVEQQLQQRRDELERALARAEAKQDALQVSCDAAAGEALHSALLQHMAVLYRC